MRIAFISEGFCLSKGNGVVSQALTWKRGLEALGHQVVLINSWQYEDLSKVDVIQIFGFSESTTDLVAALYLRNQNIVLAPIFDPDYSIYQAKLRSYYGGFRIRLLSRYSALRSSKPKIKYVLVRSEFERKYMIEAFGFNEEQCKIVMLPSGVKPDFPLHSKEPFCFHLSLVTDKRKNVHRLIQAAEKYKFPLVLAGGVQNEVRKKELLTWLNGTSYVNYVGFLSEEEKVDYYRRAKVFALPSTNEGVGLVALEAACYGCDIVITSLGGPKEYYGSLAEVVNPYDIDEIGLGVRRLLDQKTYQPQLAEYINKKFSLENISIELESIYKSL